ncbi:hypothetical protein BH23ACT5_BH23ACT5_19680 [soil metagenome]
MIMVVPSIPSARRTRTGWVPDDIVAADRMRGAVGKVVEEVGTAWSGS